MLYPEFRTALALLPPLLLKVGRQQDATATTLLEAYQRECEQVKKVGQVVAAPLSTIPPPACTRTRVTTPLSMGWVILPYYTSLHFDHPAPLVKLV
jgi:hypothetical protein